MKMRGERQGEMAWMLAKRGEDRERGITRRGKDSLEKITSRGNKGGQIAKNGRGREEDSKEPGIVASEQVGLLAKKICNRLSHRDNREQIP
jgi:hypothetical protein